MKILHITPETNGYEEATLIANRINRTNSLHAIEVDGKPYWTGGFIINDTPEIRAVLDAIPKEKQYEFVKSFKMEPWVKAYLEEEKPAPVLTKESTERILTIQKFLAFFFKSRFSRT